MAHGPSCSAACGIFPDQGSNPYPLHWQVDSQPLCYQGSPLIVVLICISPIGHVELLFICLLSVCTYFMQLSIQIPCLFCLFVFFFPACFLIELSLHCWNSLYILDIKSLSDIRFANIFLPFYWLPFHFDSFAVHELGLGLF